MALSLDTVKSSGDHVSGPSPGVPRCHPTAPTLTLPVLGERHVPARFEVMPRGPELPVLPLGAGVRVPAGTGRA